MSKTWTRSEEVLNCLPSKNSEPDTPAGVGRVSVSFLEPLTRTLELLVNGPFAISVAIIVNVDHRC